MINTNFDNLVYLDSGFISSKYEEIKEINPDTEFTKVEGIKATASVPFISAGVHTQETKKFKISSVKMFSEIEKKIMSYLDFDEKCENFSKLVWVNGNFSTSEWTDSETKELDGEPFFYIRDEKKNQFPLIIKPEYFLSGIEQFVNLPSPFQKNIGFSVRALIRIFYISEYSKKYYISTPYIIYEKANK